MAPCWLAALELLGPGLKVEAILHTGLGSPESNVFVNTDSLFALIHDWVKAVRLLKQLESITLHARSTCSPCWV